MTEKELFQFATGDEAVQTADNLLQINLG